MQERPFRALIGRPAHRRRCHRPRDHDEGRKTKDQQTFHLSSFVLRQPQKIPMSQQAPQFCIGLVGVAETQVVPELTARHLGSGAVSVFATPEMVRLMERAAVNALKPHLATGQQSVGTMVNVRHLAATPVGTTVTAKAELTSVDGRQLTFKVTAHDGTELIGEGTHERALIDLARFEAKVKAKAEAK
jgi:fluoroacetyl-CoA thioesterase